MVVLLRDVHLRLRWNDNRPSGDHPENGKEKFHPSGASVRPDVVPRRVQ